MIKFFRRARRKLINEKHLSKYTLYAIGEILLVVIGILIALQLNQWNENSKDRKLEAEYYSRFKLELEENIRNAEDQIQYSEFQISNAEMLINALENDRIYENNQYFFVGLEHLGNTYPTQYTNYVWTELLSNGKTSIIRNLDFREKLAFLNSEMIQAIGLQKELMENNYNYRKLTADLFSISLSNALDSKMHPVRFIIDSTQILNLPNQQDVVSKLKAINGLNGCIANLYQSKKVNKYLFGKHKILMLELVEICENELLNTN